MKNPEFIFTVLLLLMSFSIPAQPPSSLTLPEIMKGHDFVGYLPEDVYWADDSKTIYFTWNPDKQKLRDQYKVSIRGLKPEKLSLEEQKGLPAFTGEYNKNKTKKVYSKDGDLFILEIKSGEINRITSTNGRESAPFFSIDEKYIIYRFENNLYRWSISGGQVEQLTNFVNEDPSRDEKLSEREQWLEQDQLSLFQVLKERKELKTAREARTDSLSYKRPVSINIKGKSLMNLTLSPDQHYALFQLATRPGNGEGTEVPDYVTESGYAGMLRARAKVGSPQNTYEMGIYDLARDTSYFIDTKQIPGIYDKPIFLKNYIHPDSTFVDQYKKPRDVSFWGPVFNDLGTRAMIVIRALDNKDRWIMELKMKEGALRLIDRQRDEAWVGGPGISEWNFGTGNIGWVNDDICWYQSEESGYSHIYTFNTLSGNMQQLTSGSWEVYAVSLSSDKKYFYVTANREGPAERHFYRLPVQGGEMVRYTTDPGNYEVKVSPDEKLLAIRYSYSNQPWELFIMPNRQGASMQQVTYSTTDAFNAYHWRNPEIVSFKADDGETVHARLYKPENPVKAGPAVIFVHGAGYLQNAHHWWSQYFREYMFHNLLADHGYTVLDIDYRGSEGYGRDWRTGIYRHMGGKDLTDQVDGVRYLTDNHEIDPSHIGIYGGSYGGFITIFAMFRYPGVFNCGAALRSVTDWAHYNHGYTSNRLNTPVTDSIAYRQSSPVYYADGLEGELVMLHGIIDTNVHFQDVVRLSQKLIELGKENWQLAVFPLESHGFEEASSWADEYRRIFELFERNLQ